MMYREEAKLFGAFRYNDWIKEFKGMLLARNKIDFWENIVVKGEFGLITNKECDLCTVTEDEAEEFYKNNISSKIMLPAGDRLDDEDDIDDLLGDM